MTEDKVQRYSDVIELGVRKYGMKVGNLKAPLVLEVGIKATRKLKAAAKRKGGNSETIRHRESNYLSEYALNRYLTKRKHFWGGLGSTSAADFKLWRGNEVFTVDVHSGHHRELMDFKDNPVIFYPVWRASAPDKYLNDYLVAASVYSYKNGSSGIANWGAIGRGRLLTIMLRLWGDKPVPTSGNTPVHIPLAEFDPKLMMDLLEHADAGRRRYRP